MREKTKIILKRIFIFVLVILIIGIMVTCTVQVTSPQEVTLHTSSVDNWQVGWSADFVAYVDGNRVENSTLTWESSDTSVATCVNGKLTAVGMGTATITCTKENATAATCTVQVTGSQKVTLHTDSVNNWQVGWSADFVAYVDGNKVENSTLIWESSDTSVATCVKGKLTAVGVGTATITCTKENAAAATCTVQVIE